MVNNEHINIVSVLWERFHALFRKEFVSNVAMLSIGVLVAQTISVATAPVITRLFLPENFGIMAIFISLTELLAIVAALSYEGAIVLPKDDSDAANIFWLSAFIEAVFILVLVIAVLVSRRVVASVFEADELGFWLLFLPVVVCVKSAVNILKSWMVRTKMFRFQAVSDIIEAGVSAGVKIGVGFLIGATTGGLIAGTIMGAFFSFLFLVAIILRRFMRNMVRWFSVSAVRQVAYEYRQFPYFSSINNLLIFLSQNIVVFLLGYFFTPAVVGFFYLARRILAMPIMIVAQSVNRVYYQKASGQKAHGRELLKGFRQATAGLAALGVLPFGILIVYGPVIFSFVFGREWEEAGRYVQVLSPWVFFLFISAPSNAIYNIFLKQHVLLVFQVVYNLLTIASIAAGYVYSGQAITSLALFSLLSVVFLAIKMIVAFIYVKKDMRQAATE